MPTQAQLDANRANARHSTGPQTPEGKAASSRNNFRHGFRSQTVVLPGEDSAEFQQLLDEINHHFAPADLTDQRCAQEMAAADWRLARVRRLLHDALTAQIETLAEQYPEASPDRLQRLAVEALNESRTSYSTWLRYEAKYQRDYDRAYQALTLHRQRARATDARELEAFIYAPVPAPADPPRTFEPNSAPHPPRNSPCPCGSGLKFKRCCGPSAAPTLSVEPPPRQGANA